ncbi:hypothetical protein M5K25_023773 [Dendrobium thyrsiflorum]|uniref:Uncharacterized protein n=1 Tax=Dendrobium thyrsiflorum TaxID=117978 RepID=A0ABD0U0N2_DENTH
MVTDTVLIFSGRRKRLFTQAAEFSSISLILIVFNYGIVLTGSVEIPPSSRGASMASFDELRLVFNRKILHDLPGWSGGVTEPERVGELECTKDDILLHQQATEPMPNGIPTYTVNVLSTCPERSGCSMAMIHLSCGWFSSARQINPTVLRRLGFNDCLLNNGRPLPSGFSLSFQYANTYPYSFSISAAECLNP